MKWRSFIIGSVLSATVLASAPASPPTNLWFEVGEKLTYRIRWGVIPVGTSVASTEWIEEDGRTLLRIRFRNRSNSFLSTFYPVDDTLEAVVDPVTFKPVRFVKILNEGGYHCDEVTEFDYENGVARWRSRKNGGSKEYPIEDDARDLISFMYWMRKERLKPGASHDFRVMADEKVYDLTVHVKKSEKVNLPEYGKVKSVKLEPAAKFQGLFVRKGRMWMWVSEDERRLCTQLAVEVPVAKVKLKLCSVEGPGKDHWTERAVKCKEDEDEDVDDDDEWLY